MSDARETGIQGRLGHIALHQWPHAAPDYVALIAHGYGEHARRYDHVAERLLEHGAAVYAPDHLGHGRSEGERARIDRFDDLVDDLHAVAERARADHPGLPVVLIGHSMGGLVASLYAQRHGTDLAALVLSGPGIGSNPAIAGLLEMDPIPEVPIDPESLSRDPAVGRDYAADPLVWHGPFLRPTLEAFFSAAGDLGAGPKLGSLPTLWIHGDQDTLVPLEPTRQALESLSGDRLESIVYEGARHELFNETNREEVLDAVVAFLERCSLRESRTS